MNPLARFVGHAWLVLVAALLAGCAGMEHTPGRGGDSSRLENALVTDNVSFVRNQIQSGTLNVNARVPAEAWPDGAPLIAIAARAGALNVLRYLISAGADVNARSPVGETPLMLAAYFGDDDEGRPARVTERHERAARILVEAGADLENLPYHYTPLAYAAYQGNERMVRFLLERGARVDSDAQGGGTYVNTPLMMAAIQGHESIVRALLRAGANADVRVFGGSTAAEFASRYNHRALAQLLVCAQRQPGGAAVSAQCRPLQGADAARDERLSAR